MSESETGQKKRGWRPSTKPQPQTKSEVQPQAKSQPQVKPQAKSQAKAPLEIPAQEPNDMKNVVVDPYYPSLEGKDARAAAETLIHTFPQVIRSANDHIPGTPTYTAVAFKIFDPPKPTADPKNKLYGFVKIRGMYNDEDVAKVDLAERVRRFDSYHHNFIGQTGVWLPITLSTMAAKGNVNVKPSSGDAAADEQIRSAEKAMQADLNQEARQKKDRYDQELAERTARMKAEAETVYDPFSLDEYTAKRNSEMNLASQLLKAKEQYNKIVRAYNKTMESLRETEGRHPEYTDQWLNLLNDSRKKVGYGQIVLLPSDHERYASWRGIPSIE